MVHMHREGLGRKGTNSKDKESSTMNLQRFQEQTFFSVPRVQR